LPRGVYGCSVLLVTPNGAAIKAFREARGYSVRHLARLTRRDPSFISRIEAGTRGQRSEVTLHRIAEALNVPIQAITRENTS
jgi:transcriptional regulator with XRE-family HTH domain